MDEQPHLPHHPYGEFLRAHPEVHANDTDQQFVRPAHTLTTALEHITSQSNILLCAPTSVHSVHVHVLHVTSGRCVGAHVVGAT
ncbi:hypothetical protein EVAR_89675_1 [Eumeta japonica]|uniref:Uncharacterized protein n=1 Tax=Eumeta variegata TaxID=151549 RepID=A0A4C1YD59_EUMVA|nr:hypothetical protein EVAR_89675_1 [Eumeta japonica]